MVIIVIRNQTLSCMLHYDVTDGLLPCIPSFPSSFVGLKV